MENGEQQNIRKQQYGRRARGDKVAAERAEEAFYNGAVLLPHHSERHRVERRDRRAWADDGCAEDERQNIQNDQIAHPGQEADWPAVGLKQIIHCVSSSFQCNPKCYGLLYFFNSLDDIKNQSKLLNPYFFAP